MSLGEKLLVIAVFVASLGCETFDPPPEPAIEGLDNGVMTTAPDAPLRMTFSERFVGDSLRMKIVRAEFDGEGNLLDEGQSADPDAFAQTVVVAYDGRAPDDGE